MTKVVIIGLDGATFKIIKPLIDQGRLLNLRQVITNGAHANLTSTIPAWTIPAWPTAMTGKNPAKHNFFGGNLGRTRYVNSSDRRSKALWNLLSEQGKRCTIINVPGTYPPEKIDGIMVSGFYTPNLKIDIATHPKNLARKLIDINYQIDVKDAQRKYLTNPELFLSEVTWIEEKRGEVGLYLMEKIDWDFFMIVFMGLDRVGHYSWDKICTIYEKIDDILGKFIKKLNQDTFLFIISDHGFGVVRKSFYIDNWLAKLGLLKRKKIARTRRILFLISRTLIRLAQKCHLRLLHDFAKLTDSKARSFEEVDWTNTRATTLGGRWFVRINLKGRDKNGIVKPRDYKKLRELIARELSNLVDPENGEKIIDKVYRKEEIYQGDYLGEISDILLVPKEGYSVAGSSHTDKILERPHRIFANHEIKGIFMATGPGINKNVKLNDFNMVDVMPTVLHVMDIPVPFDVDGVVRKEIFNPSSELAQIDIKYGPSSQQYRKEEAYSKKEKEEIRRHLRALGYLDE